MTYSLKKKILALLLIFGAVSAFPLYKIFAPLKAQRLALINSQSTPQEIQNTVADITQEGNTVTDLLHEELNAEHDRLLAALQQAFPLADNQWQTMHERLKAIIAQDDLRVASASIANTSENPFIATAQEVLASTGINPERITFNVIDKPQSACDASAGQCYRNNKVEHFLLLNTAQLSQRDTSVQQALLKHECMHLLNYDGLRQVFIESLLKKNNIEESVYRKHPAFCAYVKHLEFRADLFASAYDSSFAQGLLQGIQEHLQKYPNQPISSSHPSDQQRHTAIANLMQYMNAEKNIILS